MKHTRIILPTILLKKKKSVDLGRAVKYSPDVNIPIPRITGSILFQTVDILKGKHRQGPADDMYSFCEILMEMICGERLPWTNSNDIKDTIALKEECVSAEVSLLFPLFENIYVF